MILFVLFLTCEVLTLTNVELLPGLSRVKRMKTGRLVLQVTSNRFEPYVSLIGMTRVPFF